MLTSVDLSLWVVGSPVAAALKAVAVMTSLRVGAGQILWHGLKCLQIDGDKLGSVHTGRVTTSELESFLESPEVCTPCSHRAESAENTAQYRFAWLPSDKG